jgi:putative FmdB family regulatory protein
MPCYDVECPDCGEKIIDIIVRLDEEGKMPPLPNCPKCGKQMVKLFPMNTTFQLRGSGWSGKTKSSG